MISGYRLRRRRAELEAAVARRRKLRKWRLGMGVSAYAPAVRVDEMIPPFIISGPFEVHFPITGLLDTPVYTSSWYTEAPTVVNTQDAWNVIRSSTVNFPTFWNRMY